MSVPPVGEEATSPPGSPSGWLPCKDIDTQASQEKTTSEISPLREAMLSAERFATMEESVDDMSVAGQDQNHPEELSAFEPTCSTSTSSFTMRQSEDPDISRPNHVLPGATPSLRPKKANNPWHAESKFDYALAMLVVGHSIRRTIRIQQLGISEAEFVKLMANYCLQSKGCPEAALRTLREKAAEYAKMMEETANKGRKVAAKKKNLAVDKKNSAMSRHVLQGKTRTAVFSLAYEEIKEKHGMTGYPWSQLTRDDIDINHLPVDEFVEFMLVHWERIEPIGSTEEYEQRRMECTEMSDELRENIIRHRHQRNLMCLFIVTILLIIIIDFGSLI